MILRFERIKYIKLQGFIMRAIEFNTMSKDGFIYIPQEYKNELGNRKDIRLVVMYDLPQSKEGNIFNSNKEVQILEQLFAQSDNKVLATRDNTIDTDEMINDIS